MLTTLSTPSSRLILTLKVGVPGLSNAACVIRAPVLKTLGMETVADISDEAIQSVHRKYFYRAGLGREVGGIDKVSTALSVATRQQRKSSPSMLGMLFLESRNLSSGMSHNTQDKYRKMARDFGLSPADFTDAPTSVRLDYDSGLMISGNENNTESFQLRREERGDRCMP